MTELELIKKEIKKCFATLLGEQCNELFYCSDGKISIRLEDAIKHVDGQLDPDSFPLEDKKILEWFDDENYVIWNKKSSGEWRWYSPIK